MEAKRIFKFFLDLQDVFLTCWNGLTLNTCGFETTELRMACLVAVCHTFGPSYTYSLFEVKISGCRLDFPKPLGHLSVF